jgi:hypothetical protein
MKSESTREGPLLADRNLDPRPAGRACRVAPCRFAGAPHAGRNPCFTLREDDKSVSNRRARTALALGQICHLITTHGTSNQLSARCTTLMFARIAHGMICKCNGSK